MFKSTPHSSRFFSSFIPFKIVLFKSESMAYHSHHTKYTYIFRDVRLDFLLLLILIILSINLIPLQDNKLKHREIISESVLARFWCQICFFYTSNGKRMKWKWMLDLWMFVLLFDCCVHTIKHFVACFSLLNTIIPINDPFLVGFIFHFIFFLMIFVCFTKRTFNKFRRK